VAATNFAMPLVFARVCRAAVLGMACVAILAAPVAGGAQATEGLQIVPIVRDDQVLVSFDLADGFTSDVRATIKSGLKTTFTYSVELLLDVPFGFDRLIGTAVVVNTVEYDNLKRRYTLVRSIDGRTDTTNSDDETVVRQWLTSLSKLPLFRASRLEENRDYYVRVSATARPSNGSILWPFGSGISAQRKFTFIR
jgi:hypothetical protein